MERCPPADSWGNPSTERGKPMDRTHLPETGAGTRDGSGASDNDQPYVFGRRPRAIAPWPFTERQYARLLLVRGRYMEGDLNTGASTEPLALAFGQGGTDTRHWSARYTTAGRLQPAAVSRSSLSVQS